MAVLSVILLTLHLLATNVASVGPLVAIWLHFQERRESAAGWEVGRNLARVSLGCLLVGFVFGFAQLGLSWAGAYSGNWSSVIRLSSRELFFAVAELMFSVVCMAIYAATWDRWRVRPWLHGSFAFLAATNLLYHFPPLMTALGELSVRPELVSELTLTRAVLRPIIARPEILSLTIHFVVASAAVTGVVLMLLAQRQAARRPDANSVNPLNSLIVAGARLAVTASLLQLGIGTWVLFELPTRARNGLVGDDPVAAGLFLVSILGAFGILHTLASIALGNITRPAIARSALLMLAVTFLMTGTLARSRQLSASRLPTSIQDREGVR